MAELLLLPSVIANAQDATIARWLKQEGDEVSAGEAIAEIETDKAVVEIPSAHSGRVARILQQGGVAIPVDTPIAVIAGEGDDDAAVERLLASAPSLASPASSSPAASIPVVVEAVPQEPVSQDAGSVERSSARIFASPLARRLAREGGVDLSAIKGSGPHGRIMRDDVLARAKDAAALASEAPAPEAQATLAASAAQSASVLAAYADVPHEVLPHSSMRRTIARRLSEAKQTIPHFYLNAEIAVDELLELRARVNGERNGAERISINDFLVKAAAVAHRKVPACNVVWTPDALIRFDRVDIAVAVSTEGGLITPVVRSVESRSLSTVSREIADLAVRAREGSLQPHEYSGGSLTISNLGMYGVSDFTAIINPPQAAILAVGSVEERIVSKQGNAVSARMMRVTLSLDHRAIDGAVGAQWLASFKEIIEGPMQILV